MANYCAYQDRCHQEVEQKMREFLLIPEAKEELLLYLMQENFLNEERFTRSYIRGKFYFKNWGRIKIKSQLKFKGVPEKLINRCWDEIDEAEYRTTLGNLYQKYIAGLSGLPAARQRSKAIQHLLSKGYEYELILQYLKED